jgi:hypothetical protein
MRDADAPPGQDQLDVAQAQAEDVIQPDSVADDLGREAVSGIGYRLWRHPPASPSYLVPATARQLDNPLGREKAPDRVS